MRYETSILKNDHSPFVQGIRWIQISCRLQEVAAKYQGEGFQRIYITLAGSNTQKLIDLLESMFRDTDIEDLDPENLETSKVKDLRQTAAQAEEASVSKEHGPIPSDGITRVTVRSTPVPFGIWNSGNKHSSLRKR